MTQENNREVFIYGILAPHDQTGKKEADENTLNDLTLTYDLVTRKYKLWIETLVFFNNKEDECAHYWWLANKLNRWVMQSDRCVGGNPNPAELCESLEFDSAREACDWLLAYANSMCLLNGVKPKDEWYALL